MPLSSTPAYAAFILINVDSNHSTSYTSTSDSGKHSTQSQRYHPQGSDSSNPWSDIMRNPTKNTRAKASRTVQQSALNIKYRIAFNEGKGYYFVKNPGSSLIGSSALVLGMGDGQLYVRRKTTEVDQNERDQKCPGVNSFLKHDSILPLLEVYDYSETLVGVPSAWNGVSLISPFCNRGTLNDLRQSFQFPDDKVPEMLLWRVINGIIHAIAMMHS